MASYESNPTFTEKHIQPFTTDGTDIALAYLLQFFTADGLTLTEWHCYLTYVPMP